MTNTTTTMKMTKDDWGFCERYVRRFKDYEELAIDLLDGSSELDKKNYQNVVFGLCKIYFDAKRETLSVF